MRLDLPGPAATRALGAGLAAALKKAAPCKLVVHLEGGLGAGKTALVRAWLHGLGYTGRVPSPTYTLVEPYQVAGWEVRHADLYRLSGPAEVDDLGLDDPSDPSMLCLVEWPGRGGPRTPSADLVIELALSGEGRVARLQALTSAGSGVLGALASQGRTENPAVSP
ncbi:MAG: tRNA (adenosine(37)-N6)-threonylcarbamoyltransferase complex ATPase subunit type 1 TsaE [Chromatiales bacterium]|nr:tRNA (adenosine(37)-N6)-threonylcarbamoyltransferase complex ATPase subunit type 1 TsaE [Chromatiales bacterium]